MWRSIHLRRVLGTGFLALILIFCHYYHDSLRIRESRELVGAQVKIVSLSYRDHFAIAKLEIEGYPGQYSCLLKKTQDLLPGDVVAVTGQLEASRFPGSLLGDLVLSSPPTLVERPKFSPFKKIAVTIHRSFEQHLSEEKAAMTAAVFLGDRSNYYVPAQKKFQLTGTLHYLALSGLHLGLVILPFLLLFRLLRLSPRWQLLAVIPVLVIYLLMVGPIPSLLRAFVSFVVLTIAVFFERKLDAVNTLCLVAVICLICDVSQVHSVGFYMTFAALGGIVFVGPRLISYLPDSGPQWLWQVIGYNTGAWLGIAPVLLCFFGELAVGALLLNIILIPFFTLLIVACVFFMLWPSFFAVVIEKIWWFVELLLELSMFWLKRPWGPSEPTFVALLMLFLLLFVLSWKKMSQKFFVAVTLIFLILVNVLPSSNPFSERRVRQINVGQGSSYLVETAVGEAILVDCGSYSAQVGQKVIVPRLRKNGVRYLPYIFITHLDRDHWVGLEDILARYEVGCVVTSGDKGNGAYKKLMFVLKQYAVPHRTMVRGDVWELSETKIRCLHPAADSPGKENDRSLVLSFEAQKTILFTGDIDDVGTPDLLRAGVLGPVDVLTAPHHGSRNQFMSLLLKVTKPKTLWLSARRSFSKEPSVMTFPELKKSWEGDVEINF